MSLRHTLILSHHNYCPRSFRWWSWTFPIVILDSRVIKCWCWWSKFLITITGGSARHIAATTCTCTSYGSTPRYNNILTITSKSASGWLTLWKRTQPHPWLHHQEWDSPAEPWTAGSTGIQTFKIHWEVSYSLLESLQMLLSQETHSFTDNVIRVSEIGVDCRDITFNLIL